MSIIQVKNISFSYVKNKPVIKGLSLDIEEGTLTAILGKNGSGKSTLLDSLLGFNEIESGEIIIDSSNLYDLSSKELAKKVAYIQQNTTINIDYTVEEFISFGRTPYLGINGGLKEKDWNIIYSNAEKCGITHLLGKDINKISGGEKQLVCICRALIQESKILIFDEPTSSLDFDNQYKVLDLMKSLVNEGKTVIFTTHNPNQVIEAKTNVIIIDEGNVLTSGDSSIINEEILNKIYGMAFINVSGSYKYYE